MTSFNHSIGLTPILIRRAAYYLSLGLGEYFPEHPHFDKVKVHKIYDLLQNPLNPEEWAVGIRVDFYKEERVIRWVEFSSRLVGAGGDPILKDVTKE